MKYVDVKFGTLGTIILAALSGCSGSDMTCFQGDEATCGFGNATDADEQVAPLQARLALLREDLDLGSSGPDVEVVHEYLSRYGFFPNDDLAATHAAWRPWVDELPAHKARFDEHSKAAVMALQRLSGLEQTGVVDEATRLELQNARCGFPEGIWVHDAADKYALGGTTWSGSTVTWSVTNTNDVTQPEARSAALNAFALWANETDLTFSEDNSGAAQIKITFANIDGAGGTLANAFQPGSGGDVTVDSSETWSVAPASSMPAGSLDLQTTLIHEIGHALGLQHSSRTSARMRPGQQTQPDGLGGFQPIPNFQQRQLFDDDKVAISSLYDTWLQVAIGGKALDIAVGLDGSALGNVWVITKTAVGSNFKIAQLVGAVLQITNNGAAVRIAVAPNGRPWVLDAAGNIYRRTTFSPTTGTWEQIAGCATDIGIGGTGEGTDWVTGCTPVVGGFAIHKFESASSSFVQANNGAAVRIAVDTAGVPWVVDSGGGIHYRSNGGAFSNSTSAPSTWTQTADGSASDIGIGPSNYPWVLGDDLVSGDYSIHVWDKQIAGGGSPPAPAVETWIPVDGRARAISVGPNGRPWVVNNAGDIFRSRR